MDPQFVSRPPHILVLENSSQVLEEAASSIMHAIPEATVTTVNDIDSCKKVISERDFDIVVVDYDLQNAADLGLVHQFKVKDYEPAVLLVSESVRPEILNEINSLGCQRYLYKHGDWLNHLAPAVRQLMRIRRLELENRRLVAQLTEAKIFLEEKNKRLDEFCATVAHDIRGPLGGISMKLEYLQDKYGESKDERFDVLVKRAYESSRRLIDIVQAMYSYAKLGSKSAQMHELDLKLLVEEVIRDMTFDEQLDISIGLGELPTIWGNAELLRRVFINLLANAVKYNDKKEVIINIGLEKKVHRTLGTFVQIFVSDNGPGIPAAEQPAIFSMFRSGVDNKRGDGLGVGLAVVQRIVELHFGEVAVQSSPGEGCKFLVTLPAERIDFLD